MRRTRHQSGVPFADEPFGLRLAPRRCCRRRFRTGCRAPLARSAHPRRLRSASRPPIAMPRRTLPAARPRPCSRESRGRGRWSDEEHHVPSFAAQRTARGPEASRGCASRMRTASCWASPAKSNTSPLSTSSPGPTHASSADASSDATASEWPVGRRVRWMSPAMTTRVAAATSNVASLGATSAAGRSEGVMRCVVGREGFEPPKPKRLVYSQFPLSTRAPTQEAWRIAGGA